jgi:hypothetical protein
VKKLFLILAILLLANLARSQDRMQLESFGLENNAMNNSGAILQFVSLRPRTLYSLTSSIAMYVNTAPSANGLSQCLTYVLLSPHSPVHTTATQDFGSVPNFSTTAIGPPVVSDPSGVTAHGSTSTFSLFNGILKAFSPTGGTGAHADTASSQNFPGGIVINAGDWVAVHIDCNNPTGTTIDAEGQFTGADVYGEAPKYVQWFFDNTTRANESPLSNGSWWAQNPGSTTTAQIVSNKIQASAVSGVAVYYFNVASGTGNTSSPGTSAASNADQYAEVAANMIASCACNAGPMTRMQTGALSGYSLLLNNGAGPMSWTIIKHTAGATAALLSGTTPFVNGNFPRLEAQGSTLTAKLCTAGGANPVCTTLGSTTDATYATGQVGFFLQPDSGSVTDATISSFDAGNLNF